MLKNEFTNKWKRRLSNKVWLFVLLTGILVLIISVLDVDLSELLEIISPGILALGMALTPADESGQRKFEFRFNRETSDKFKKLARDLAQQRQLSNIFKLVVVQSVELFKAGGGALFLYRPNTDDLAPVFCLNLPDAINSTIIKSGEGLAGHIFKTEQTINVKDYKQWEGAARCFKIDELQAIIGAPISWGNLTLGVLLVLDRPPRIFSRQDITLLEFVTHISAAAIDRLLLKEKSMARLREAEILRQATMAVTESLSLDETLERIL
ncbi:MAG: GAF domain-containing protein, partial [Anaerolineales bacterium]|nr:GAF domain-containing protein [Anaerolineales bacterium]